MEKVLISLCFTGENCRYDGGNNLVPEIKKLYDEGKAVTVCPEVEGGLPTPRPPAEIIEGSGEEVLAGRKHVFDVNGRDVTKYFIRGAEKALETAKRYNVKMAVLKADSPSCGCCWIYSGKFDMTLKKGKGVTAALLEQEGIDVITEDEFLSSLT